MATGGEIFGYVVAGIVAWCLLSHCIFMRFCTCMKRKSKIRLDFEDDLVLGSASRGDGPRWKLACAHRGGAAEGAENTIDTFKAAIKLGLNFMECDVQMSKDGQVVIAHDTELSRMCGPDYQDKHVRDYDYADLPKFQRKIMMHTAEGHYELKDNEPGKFCLLSELFDICDGIYVSVDLNEHNPELIQKVHALIRKYKREEYTFWGSKFDDQQAIL
jgi:glycerophosphoryl diester phosphodiesterase